MWRVSGTAQILKRLDDRRASFPQGSETPSQSGRGIEILPGTEYSRIAIPLDYPPSRNFTPRYGFTHGKIDPLAKWFASHRENYEVFLKELREINLSHIAINAATAGARKPAWIGGAITSFDCLALYGMMRRHRPQTYLEIGSGMTTCFARQAANDFKCGTRIISVDPQPRQEIDSICDEVIRDGLETCDLSVFNRLGSGDILFLDGSHRSFMNSDVTVFFIDVLPILKPGVIVHIHDILLPWDYPESFKYWYWNEQYMLAVYMMNATDRLDPLLPTHWISRSPEFSKYLEVPFLDLGSPQLNDGWKHGGSMWFTKKA